MRLKAGVLPWIVVLLVAGPTAEAVPLITVVVEDDGASEPTMHAGVMTVEVAGQAFEHPIDVQVPGETVVPLTVPTPAPGHADGVGVEVEVEGYWGPVIGVASSGDEAVRLHLVPAGRLLGHIEPPQGAPWPAAVVVRLQPLVEVGREDRHQLAREGDPIKVVCPLSETGQLRCNLPAGRFDLGLRVAGMTPRYVHDVDIPVRGSLDLRVWPLSRGASVAGWVALGGGDGLLDDPRRPVTVKLTPRLQRDQTIVEVGAAQPVLTLRAFEATADRRGFFQIAGLESGSYQLEASREGYASARVEPVEVVGQAETRLDKPLRLTPPVGVEVVIDPPLSPNQEPWRILLRKDRGMADDERIDEWADLGGVWRNRRLPAGRYRLVLTDIDDTRWMASSLDIGDTTGPIFVDVPLVEIVGQIVENDDGVAADVWFGGRNGEESIHLRSDTDGHFQGYLPRLGTWIVEGSMDHGRTLLRLDDITIEQSNDDLPVPLRLEMLGGALRGTVVDDAGERVAGAVLMVVNPERRSREAVGTTEDDGTFAVPGLRSGTLFVRARLGHRSSAWEAVEVGPGRDDEPVELVIQPPLVFAGVVQSPQGPVPGTQVILSPQEDWSSMKPAVLKRAITGSDGAFSFELPADTQHADLVVLPPGFGADIRRVHAGAQKGSPLVVHVDQASGDLYLRGDFSPENTVIVHEDAFARWTWFRRWAESGIVRTGATDHDALLPDLAPGSYSVCPMTLEAVSERSDTAGGCHRGYLPANGELVLAAPSPEARAFDREH